METKKMIAEMDYAVRKRVTIRDEFLRTMDYVISWDRWVETVRPFIPEAEKDDHRVMLYLRMFLLQKWFGLQDAQLADTIYDSYAMWFFMEVQTADEWLPSHVNYQTFRDTLEKKGIYKELSEEVNGSLKRYGREMVQGALVEAVLLQRKEEFAIKPLVTEEPQQDESKIKAFKLFSADPPPIPDTPKESHSLLGDESSTIHQLETRLRRLERFKALAEYDTYDDDDDDDYEEYDDSPQKLRLADLFTPQRVLLAALLVTVFMAGVVVVYDYFQTGTWFRWFSASVSPAAAVDSDDLTPATPLPTGAIPAVVPTQEPTVAPTMAPTEVPTMAPTMTPVPTQEITPAPTLVPTPSPTQEIPTTATTQSVLIPFPVNETGGTLGNQGTQAVDELSTQTGDPVAHTSGQSATSQQASTDQTEIKKIDMAIACLKAKKTALSSTK